MFSKLARIITNALNGAIVGLSEVQGLTVGPWSRQSHEVSSIMLFSWMCTIDTIHSIANNGRCPHAVAGTRSKATCGM